MSEPVVPTPAATTPEIPAGKVSLRDIPVESNNFKPPAPPPQSLSDVQTSPDATTPPASTTPPEGGTTPPEGTPPPEGTTEPEEQIIVSQEDIQADLDFFAEVNRLRGEQFDVDYGDVVPSSLEGMAIRDRAIEAHSYQKWNAELKQRDPRGAAYLLHRMQGGNDEDFFARKTLVLPDYELFKEDVNLQKQIYKSGLLRKGLSDVKAEALVKMAVDGNSLFQEADGEYQAQTEEDQRELARLTQMATQEAAAYQQKIDGLDQMLDQTFKASDLKVIIPDSEQAAYAKFVRDLIQTDGKNFFIAQPLEPSTVKAITESLYIQFKKGDLSSIIARQAGTAVAKRNQIALGGTKRPAAVTPPPAASSNKKTLGELNFS
jgi:hypothetical protein